MSRHLAIADKQQAASTKTLLNPLDTRHIEGVIGLLARNDIRGQRHPQWIQNRVHDFNLRQIGAIIFTVTKLKQPILAHRRRSTGGGAIDMNPLGAQIVNAYGVLI